MKLENNQNLVFEPTKKSFDKTRELTYFEKLKAYIKNGAKEINDFSKEAAKLPEYLLKQQAKKEKRNPKTAIPATQIDHKKISKLPQKICTIAGLSGILLLNYIRPSEIEGKSFEEISSSDVRVAVYQRHESRDPRLGNIAFRDDINSKVTITLRTKDQEVNQHKQSKTVKEIVDYKSLILSPKSAEEVWGKIKNLKNTKGEQPKIYLNKKISSYCDGVICKDGNPPTPYFSYAVDKSMLGNYFIVEYTNKKTGKKAYIGFGKGSDTGGLISKNDADPDMRFLDVFGPDRDTSYDIGVQGEKDWQMTLVIEIPPGIPGVSDDKTVKQIKEEKLNHWNSITQQINEAAPESL